MGYTVDYFYSLTPRQFSNALDGYRARQENDNRATWEQTRFIIWACISPHHDSKKHGLLTVKSILPFPWEDEADAPQVTATEVNQIRTTQQDYWAGVDAKLAKKTDT